MATKATAASGEDWKQTAAAFLRKCLPDLQSVYVFGSRAAGREHHVHAASDYDVAFRQNPTATLNGLERFNLAAELALNLRVGYVDLVEITAPGNHLLKEQVLDGELIWTASSGAELEWSAKQLTMANDFYLSERELREASLNKILYGKS